MYLINEKIVPLSKIRDKIYQFLLKVHSTARYYNIKRAIVLVLHMPSQRKLFAFECYFKLQSHL